MNNKKLYKNAVSPNAGQPMSDEGKRCHEQQEHSSAILWVAVDLAGDPH